MPTCRAARLASGPIPFRSPTSLLEPRSRRRSRASEYPLSYRVPALRVQANTRGAPGYRQALEASFSLPGQPAPDSVRAYRRRLEHP